MPKLFHLPALLTGGATESVSTDLIMQVLSPVTEAMSMANIVTFIGAIIAACMGFVFLWWGVKKGFSAIMGAVTSGKLRLWRR